MVAHSTGNQTRVCKLDDIVCGLGHLPSGELIILGMFQKRLWRWSEGAPTLYADLSAVAAGTIDDMIVTARGHAYVGDLGFDLMAGSKPEPLGRILLVTPEGGARGGVAVCRSGSL
jgi:sugar lactone lactonase YvrE